jgi:hypothetical protein
LIEHAKLGGQNTIIADIDKVDKEDAISYIVSSAHILSTFGFSNLADLSLELLREDPLVGYTVIMAYENYLVSGHSMGLGGLRLYDRFDLEAMTFFRIFKKRGLLSRFLGAIKKEGRSTTQGGNYYGFSSWHPLSNMHLSIFCH